MDEIHEHVWTYKLQYITWAGGKKNHVFCLRIPAIHNAQNSCLLHFAQYFCNQTGFQKSEGRFLTNGP